MQPENEMATEKEIDELLIFIGGFEKWPLLIEDCRREVVKYLDYKSRFNLGICSKEDQKTVEKTKICVKSVEISDNVKSHCYQINQGRQFVSYQFTFFSKIDSEFQDNVTVRIRFPNGKSIKWLFSQLEQDTRVQWIHFTSGDFILRPMAKYPFATSQIESLPVCKKVSIGADDVDSFDWWLKKCPEQLYFLQLTAYSANRESFTLPPDFLNAPRVMQASKIRFGGLTAFSDEQLLKLKAKSMSFESADVTDKGVNEFMKNWACGNGVDGFKDLRLWSTTVRNPDLMFAGSEYVEWDEAFFSEQWEFVERFDRLYDPGRRYQIKSKVDRFESLTLGFYDECVKIFATGKRAEKNGEAYTYYRIP
ncbi:hypothetical protein CAEBREN_25029 [Caenorhabditis brenneri]|uniref:F-box associated domain-containing protein n=1 Tax=Caenorhabditis brenneri TaxID=135651 RepID=G0N067_CAEBE|nr:hypothetical protein CAEBREN_25029 [Caenorhabditis brenneri]